VIKGDTGALFLILYLLPGFVGAVVYDYLVERQSPSNFERFIEALVLTLVSSVVAHVGFHVPLLPKIALSNEAPMTDVLGAFLGKSIFYVSIIASVISFIFATANNHKWIYWPLNRLRITYKNGEDDVWKDTFYKHRGFWISLKFEDGRVLIGWPKFYSQSGKPREIFVAEPTWWQPDAAGNLVAIVAQVAGVYVTDFSKVVSLELLDGTIQAVSKNGDRKWWSKLGDHLRKVLECDQRQPNLIPQAGPSQEADQQRLPPSQPPSPPME
jgi:hypothetical protein